MNQFLIKPPRTIIEGQTAKVDRHMLAIGFNQGFQQKMTNNFDKLYPPCSLESVDSRAWGFEGFRFGVTFGFRVAIILLSSFL